MRRRDFISTAALGGLSLSACLPNPRTTTQSNRSLRVVHITDMHLFPDEAPKIAISNLLQEIENLEIKPDFILNTGDNIMDALKKSKQQVEKQWEAWNTYFRKNVNYPLYNCIGNHDVWGWGLDDHSIERDDLYGKNWAMKMLQLEKRYYSFEQNNWKIICLDSPQQNKKDKTYTAKLDDEQFTWLKNTLSETPATTPILIASHIPIISPSVFFDGDNENKGDWNIPGSWMHIDARKIKDLFANYPNVKLAVSGHVHLADEVKYLNVNYRCNGAASGGWWKGNYQEFPPAFAIIDLFDDGSFENQLIYYNWKSQNSLSWNKK